MYPGLTIIGTHKFSGLYGCNETIIDQKAIGLQHLFIDDYSVDLVYTACSVLTNEGISYFGDRIKPKAGHALRQKSSSSSVQNHCIYEDVFTYEKFVKTDRVTAVDQDYLYFETEIENRSDIAQAIKLSALCITENQANYRVKKVNDMIVFAVKGKTFAVKAQKSAQSAMSLDAPTGFMYKGIEDILFEKHQEAEEIQSDTAIATSLSDKCIINPHETTTFKWILVIGDDEADCLRKGQKFDFDDVLKRSAVQWRAWLGKSYRESAADALVALKAANLNGLLPADLTGHYFANHRVCFYVRDALMASRAFLYAGHYEEFREVIRFLMACPVKENGEFYQRYNADQLPDEGANNNVFSQVDSIGYFARVIADYYHLTGELLIDFDRLRRTVDVLDHIHTKNGLYGPEGGVNEGVYGPAYITSTNMFIAGGLLGAATIASTCGEHTYQEKWTALATGIIKSCEATFLEEEYYAYGYVDYHEDLVLKYDTPQLFGGSLGYPITARYRKSFRFLAQFGTYFGYGFGYSEQEYHNGPWIFNTAAAAQVAYLIHDKETYEAIMSWLKAHRNAYGLLPEAVDATDETNCFINPLIWANAEYICCHYMDVISKCRGELDECS
ncbi:glycoside hydrolase family 15 protein [Fusibacter bizertensis]